MTAVTGKPVSRWARVLRWLNPGVCSMALLMGVPVHGYVLRAILRGQLESSR